MKDVFKLVRENWPLFFGLSMIMIGNGLQGTLLGVRATIEDFSFISTGVIMSAYFAGYFIGSGFVPKLVRDVGHIRVFTALASLASTTVLFNGLFVEPITWTIVRLVAGLAYAGMFIVVESWVNDISHNKIRGKLMACYTICGFGSMFFGQFLMNVASPEGMSLFVLTSVLVSLALLPISLSKRPGPKIKTPKPISFKELFDISPTAMIGVCVAGFAGASIMTIGPVYAISSGMSVSQTSFFIAVYILGGILGQIPVGLLSDKVGRRTTIIMICIATIFVAILSAVFAHNFLWLYILFGFLGCFTASLYPVCSAYTNDRLEKDQLVGASSRVIIVSGAGSLTGPIVTSIAMTIAGPLAFFYTISVLFMIYTVFTMGRVSIRPAVPLDEQSDFVSTPARLTSMTANMVTAATKHSID